MPTASLDKSAKEYIRQHFPHLASVDPEKTNRQAKMPGAPCQHVYDFSGTANGTPQRVRLILDDDGKVVKASISR